MEVFYNVETVGESETAMLLRSLAEVDGIAQEVPYLGYPIFSRARVCPDGKWVGNWRNGAIYAAHWLNVWISSDLRICFRADALTTYISKERFRPKDLAAVMSNKTPFCLYIPQTSTINLPDDPAPEGRELTLAEFLTEFSKPPAGNWYEWVNSSKGTVFFHFFELHK